MLEVGILSEDDHNEHVVRVGARDSVTATGVALTVAVTDLIWRPRTRAPAGCAPRPPPTA